MVDSRAAIAIRFVSAWLNRQAVMLARAAGDSASEADLYIRRSYIAADVGEHEAALALAQFAAGIYASIGDPVGHGRALVDCGRWFHYLGRYRDSIAARERALALLPESLPGNRFGAFQGLGLVHLKVGELDAAEKCVELAEPLAPSDRDRGKLLWLRARILRKRGRLDESTEHFRRVVETFRKIHYGEAALSACELVQVLFEQRKPGEAREVCRSMLSMLESLRVNPVVDAAAGELARAGVVGSLSLDLVRRVTATIEAARGDARTRREWRAQATAG